MLDKKESGSVMVEAVIYMPITIMLVMLLLYLGLFKLQQQAMIHEVQRVASQASKQVAFPGYLQFGRDVTNQVDFVWSGTTPDWEKVKRYYENANNTFTMLYREFTGPGSWIKNDDINKYLKNLTDSITLFTVGNMTTEAKIKRGIVINTVTTTITYGFETPGAIRYFGMEGPFKLKECACAVAINPADFARDVDLAADVITVLAKKLNINMDKAIDTANKLIGFL